MNSRILSLAAAGLLLSTGTAQANEWTANIAASNNYIWRGLTQSVNEVAVSGGIDFTADNGFYAGTWVSNVSYAADDVYSYEHDLYAGFSGEAGGISYDLGYLYFNYDEEAEFDFGEVYGSIGFNAFTLGINILANTEAEEGLGQDFGFGKTTYTYADYATEIGNGVELGLHVGFHQGDFSEAFNGVPGDYADYNVSLSKDGFSFMITSTDLDDAGPDALDNDEVKFVVGYALDFAL
ncbi:MAG: TorF family putative porin [Pseudomonadales bacterium]|jgi:uncharacterized protein (TIGR02001 family)|uniref:Histidine kinase n=1 Tax=SAR86 cluster bacterium TaxID=2030880 RepID=A0A972VU44_9GAMM|nr:hypothetical protein [SAR86 cluster bacterium]|tara:strand:- start:1782 stop:2492 length:711 start_codon:yes stop_codon:yes gene_type:complete